MMPQRIVLHVDMDQFFAACEILRKPELKGKPLVVGADPKGGRGRGVVSTCSYEGRKLGVKSGMPISRAYKLCPNCVFLQPDFILYAEVSHQVMEILRSFAVKFESWGIDEAFLEVTGKAANFEEAEKLAREVKDAVNKTRADLDGNKIVIFQGPIKDQDGNVKVAEGKVLTDDVMGSVDWFVEGVIGKAK